MRFEFTIALKNLWTDKFSTFCAILGIMLGTTIVDVVLIIDQSTTQTEIRQARHNQHLSVGLVPTVKFRGVLADGSFTNPSTADEETQEDYEIMRAAIRAGALGAFAVGALIVFFTFSVVVERRKRALALLNSIGGTRSQLIRVLIIEAILIGVVGSLLGLVTAFPLSAIAAMNGITTTGRTMISRLWIPYSQLGLVSIIATISALLAVLRPMWSIRKLDVCHHLSPRYMASQQNSYLKRQSTVSLLILPLGALAYLLFRPFLRTQLTSLNFFLVEVILLCLVFIAGLWLVPEVVSSLGKLTRKIILQKAKASDFLVLRRIETQGRDVAWSISAVMLVFGTLLGLHLMVLSLKNEVRDWAHSATDPYWFVYSRNSWADPAEYLPSTSDSVFVAHLSQRTPWPNSVLSISKDDIVELAKRSKREDLQHIADAFEPGTVLLSTMLAKRYELEKDDFLEITSSERKRRFRVIGVSDELGYVPTVGPYRNGRTYALINSAEHDFIQDYAAPPGKALIISDPTHLLRSKNDWSFGMRRLARTPGVFSISGEQFGRIRAEQTENDFLIFDWLLAFTCLLAGIGIANQMTLSAHVRRAEIALFSTLGMTTAQITRMFVFEGLIIGLFGGLFAIVLGVPLGKTAVDTLESLSAFALRFELQWELILLVFVGSATLSVLSSALPASRIRNAKKRQQRYSD